MTDHLIAELEDINQKKGLPRNYRFNQKIRWFVLLLATASIFYAIWIILYKIDPESAKFHKMAPFVIMFFAFNVVMKNLFSINTIRFESSRIVFKYIGRPSIPINWEQIRSMKFAKSKRKIIEILWDKDGTEKKFFFNVAYPNMLEIINAMAELTSNVEFDDFLEKVIVSAGKNTKTQSSKPDATT